MKCRAPWLVEQGFEIDLVHQNSRTHLRRHLTHLAHGVVIGEGAARVVQVAENHETRLGREFAFQFSQPRRNPFSAQTFEATYLRPKVIENCQQRIVGGPLDQHLVAAVDRAANATKFAIEVPRV